MSAIDRLSATHIVRTEPLLDKSDLELIQKKLTYYTDLLVMLKPKAVQGSPLLITYNRNVGIVQALTAIRQALLGDDILLNIL
jgi:hypothetical protein